MKEVSAAQTEARRMGSMLQHLGLSKSQSLGIWTMGFEDSRLTEMEGDHFVCKSLVMSDLREEQALQLTRFRGTCASRFFQDPTSGIENDVYFESQ